MAFRDLGRNCHFSFCQRIVKKTSKQRRMLSVMYNCLVINEVINRPYMFTGNGTVLAICLKPIYVRRNASKHGRRHRNFSETLKKLGELCNDLTGFAEFFTQYFK